VKVILTENLPALGTAGTVVEVTRGYARNFLIPSGQGAGSHPGNLARFESQRARMSQEADKGKEAALELAARLAEVSLTIPQRVGESERLYGSVTNVVIAQALEEQGFVVDRKAVGTGRTHQAPGDSYLVSVAPGPGSEGPGPGGGCPRDYLSRRPLPVQTA
jgi:large subunit ribosomal protein L9